MEVWGTVIAEDNDQGLRVQEWCVGRQCAEAGRREHRVYLQCLFYNCEIARMRYDATHRRNTMGRRLTIPIRIAASTGLGHGLKGHGDASSAGGAFARDCCRNQQCHGQDTQYPAQLCVKTHPFSQF